MKLHSPKNIPKILEYTLTIIILLESGYLLWMFFDTIHFLFQDAFSLNMVEGLSLYLATKLQAGQSIYTSAYRSPFTLNLYPPGYPLLSAGLLSLFPFIVNKIFILRAFTLLSEICLSALVSLIIYKNTHSYLTAITFMCVGLGLWSIHSFHGIARLDFITVGFSFLTLYFYMRVKKTEALTDIIGYILGGVFALFTKQTGILIIIACIIDSILIRPQKKSIYYAHFVIAEIYIVGIFILNILTNGEYITQNYLYQMIFGFSSEHRNSELHTLNSFYGYMLLWLGVSLTINLNIVRITYVLLSLVWTVFSLGKIGADLNYAIELIAVSILSIGLVFGENIKESKKYLVSLFFLCIFVTQTVVTVLSHGFFYYDQFSGAARKEKESITKLFQSSEGLILSEDPLFLVSLDKNAVTYDPFFVWNTLHASSPQSSALVSTLRSGKIHWIYVSRMFDISPAINDVLQDQFTLVYESHVSLVHGYWKIYKRIKDKNID